MYKIYKRQFTSGKTGQFDIGSVKI